MKIITRKENMVYRELKYMQMDMNTAVSEEMLRRNLDLPEHEYHEIALNLKGRGSFQGIMVRFRRRTWMKR